MDYAEIGEEGIEGAARKLLVGKDHGAGFHCCHVVRRKGLGGGCIAEQVIVRINETDHATLSLTTTGEPALVQV